jgi:hypothetical protein
LLQGAAAHLRAEGVLVVIELLLVSLLLLEQHIQLPLALVVLECLAILPLVQVVVTVYFQPLLAQAVEVVLVGLWQLLAMVVLVEALNKIVVAQILVEQEILRPFLHHKAIMVAQMYF